MGEKGQWPQSLMRTAVSMVMEAALPMALLWGPKLTLLFNDAYGKLALRDTLSGFGQPTDEQESCGAIAACIAEDGRELTFHQSPMRLESGAIGGTLITVQGTGGHGHQQTPSRAAAMRNAYLVRLNDAIRHNGGLESGPAARAFRRRRLAYWWVCARPTTPGKMAIKI